MSALGPLLIVAFAHAAVGAPLGAQLGAQVGAQPCDTTWSRTSLAAYSGRRIDSVQVVTLDPDPLPGPAGALDRLHVRTRPGTVRRELRFAAGDTVDTLRVAESLRRLRRLRFLRDVDLGASSCDGRVTLTVTTRDTWTTRPSVDVRSASSAFQLTERNLLGTGRTASLGVRSDRGRVGVGASLRDPALLGDRVTLDLSSSRYRDGAAWSALVARRERSVLDPWGLSAAVSRSSRLPVDASAGDAFQRTRVGVLGDRRVHVGGDAVTLLQAGVELERAELTSAVDALRIGPRRVSRELGALDLGVRRRAVTYDTLTWLLPGDAIVDVPRALELDALVGLGHERVGGDAIAHVDLWAGRLWQPRAGALVVGDLWLSGYATTRAWSAGMLRGSVAGHRAASRGTWTARAAAEWLMRPDPDLRAFVTADPTASALVSEGRLAEAVVAASIERDVRLRSLTRSWVLDGAVFGAASSRWDAPAPPAALRTRVNLPPERMDVGVLGLGLRLSPTRAGRATARLDVGYPLLRGFGVRPRPFIAIGVTPWLEQGRGRDGDVDR